jgi:hypothetical protein
MTGHMARMGITISDYNVSIRKYARTRQFGICTIVFYHWTDSIIVPSHTKSDETYCSD